MKIRDSFFTAFVAGGAATLVQMAISFIGLHIVFDQKYIFPQPPAKGI